MTRVDVLSLEKWESFQTSTPAPTFFAAPAWSLAIVETFPRYEIYPLRLVLSSGNTSIIPLLRATDSKLRWRVIVGMPFGTYTSIMMEDGSPSQQAAVDEAIRLVKRHADTMTITLWPLGPQPSLVSEAKMYETSIIDLSGGAEAAIANMEGTSRRMAGQAARKGVVCTCEGGQSALETYYGILTDAAREWDLGRPTISKELLSAVARRGGTDVQIWLARFEGRAIAGGVVLYGRDEAFFWSAATVPEYAVLRANNALSIAIIRSAALRNVKWLNLGASKDLPGVLKFKRRLGAASVPYGPIIWHRPIYKLIQLVRSTTRQKNSPEAF